MTERITKATAIAAAVSVVLAIAVTNNYSHTYAINASPAPTYRHSTSVPTILETYNTLEEDIVIVPDEVEEAKVESMTMTPREQPITKYGYDCWFSDEYLQLQNAIKEYADQYASFEFHGVQFDGLAVMAQANTESDYMSDKTQSLTALYPSTFVPLTNESDIASLGIDKVWANPSALSGTYKDMPRWSYAAGPYYAWSTGDGIYEQGPLQQRVTPTSVEVLGDSESEYAKLVRTGVLDTAKDTLYGFEATSLCTGTEYLDYQLGYETVGDRWSIKDNCLIWKAEKTKVLEELWDNYYSTCGYTPSTEEYLAILSYAHWVPSVVMGHTSLDTVRFYGFSKQDAWFELAHQLASDQALSIIREHAISNIEKNRSLHYEEGYTKDEATRLFKMALSAGSTTYVSESEPWQIFNECVELGIVDGSLIIENPAYGYQHAMKYAIQYLYAYEMLELLLEGY